jgi:preprotein translocase SecE subunit
MARNRQKAKERQARRKAEGSGNGPPAKQPARPAAHEDLPAAKQPARPAAHEDFSAPERKRGDDPIADDVVDEFDRGSVAAGPDPITPVALGGPGPVTPPLSGSERIRAGDAAEADQEPELGYPEIENDPEHFDPDQDEPEDVEDLAPGPRGHRGDGEADKEGSRLVQFLRSVVAELRRVQWPDRQALTTLTGVVLGFVIIAGTYLGLLDAIFQRLIDAII